MYVKYLWGRSRMFNGLEDEIEFTRRELLETACREGLAAEVTMVLSRKLDALINQYDAQKKERFVKNELTMMKLEMDK